MRIAIFFILILAGICANGQETTKADVVLMNNGDQKSGKVIAIADDAIKFVYTNESLEYILKKVDINKITFASGRIEFYNSSGSSNSATPTLEDFHNKVAILPFGYIRDQKDGGQEMPIKIQNECFTILGKKAKTLQVQDVQTTNALLTKAGVNNGNIQGYTMGEICHILNVEYVVQGMVSVDETDQISSSVGSTNTDVKNGKNNTIGKIFSTSSATSISSKNYNTNVTMNIYDNGGQQLFNQNHNSFWPDLNAYDITLNYLLKKTPLYGK